MIRSFLTLLLVILTGTALGSSPAEAVRLAHADAQRLPAGGRPHARYLTLYHVGDKKALETWVKVLAFHANSLSDQSDFGPLVAVAPGLYRLDLRDFGWKAATWEKLNESGEPYFHVQTLVTVQQPVKETPAETRRVSYDYGRTWVVETVKPAQQKQEAKTKQVAAAAPWLPTAEIAALILLTQSQIPVVRADWWLYQTAVAEGRKAGYYDWLNLGNAEKDFQALVGADVKLAQRLRKETAAIVARSTVTLNNRSMVRVPTLTGAYWFTQDYAASTDRKNTLRLLDGDARPDASEQYGSLPNGLFAFWLQNGQGVRQNTAPDNIASDGKATGTDRRVHVGLSCIRCHSPGIQPINDWARKVYQPPFSLDSPDYERQKRLRSLYLSDLNRQVKRDQDDYAATLKGLNGLTPTQNAKAYADAWDAYAEADVDLAGLAAEIGVKKETLESKLKAAAKGRALDPVLAGLLQNVPARREHVEEVFGIAAEIAR